MSPYVRWSLLVCAAALLALVVFPPPPPAQACAAVGRRPIRVVGEEALIVWEPQRGMQHFIRTADFEGAREDFGFLVPTPARPRLAEVQDAVFARLFQIYRAPARRGGRPRASRNGARRERSSPPPVVVLERRTVAGLDASVLAAADAGALDRWLGQHGYPSGPELRAWLERYVRERWIVTAFRIDPRAHAGGRFGTSAVRMSFRTTRPVFPYSEPQHAAPAAPGRPFRVSVVAPYRVRASVGERPFGGTVGYANRPGSRLVEALRGVTEDDAVSARSWLTVFDEPASQRGTDDLFFDRDPDQSQVAPQLRRQIVSPGGADRSGRPSIGSREIENPF